MLVSLWSEATANASRSDRDARTTAAAQQLCEACRASGMRAEQVVLALKEHCWVRECSDLDQRRDAERTLAALISLCIREFYRSPAEESLPAAIPRAGR